MNTRDRGNEMRSLPNDSKAHAAIPAVWKRNRLKRQETESPVYLNGPQVYTPHWFHIRQAADSIEESALIGAISPDLDLLVVVRGGSHVTPATA